MTRGYSRNQRIADLIQTALAEILLRSASDFGFGMVTVTGVTLAHDLSFAKVYVSVLEDQKSKETIVALNQAAKELRYALANSIELRNTPKLKFIYDDSTVRGSQISAAIEKALKR